MIKVKRCELCGVALTRARASRGKYCLDCARLGRKLESKGSRNLDYLREYVRAYHIARNHFAQRLAILNREARKVVNLLDELESLMDASSDIPSDLGEEVDALLARMQSPRARTSMRTAFNASSSQLGRAAVKAAKKKIRAAPRSAGEH